MAPRLVPYSTSADSPRILPTLRRPLRSGKRRPPPLAMFCKDFFSKRGGSQRNGLREAAQAWGKLSQEEKAAWGTIDSPLDLVTPSRGGQSLSSHSQNSAQFGEYTVVAGREPLGAGGFGQALEVIDASGRSLCLKLFHDHQEASAELEAYDRIERAGRYERTALMASGWDSFLRVVAHNSAPPLLWMALPLVPGRNLLDQLRSHRLVHERVADIVWDIYCAIKFLHNVAGMLHLDVKPENMMWHNEKLVLLDFSLWEKWPVPGDRRLATSYCTQGYRAPEVQQLRFLSQADRRTIVTPALDWWSLGCTTALLAWSTLAEPDQGRPLIEMSLWADLDIRHRDIAHISPPSCPLRPILDMLLDPDPWGRYVLPLEMSAVHRCPTSPAVSVDSQSEEGSR